MGRHDDAPAVERIGGRPSALAEQARVHLGALENAAGEYDAALAALAPFEADAIKTPLGEKVLLERGWALYKLRRYADAEKCLNQILEHDAQALEPRYWLGMVLAADRRWAAAIEPLSAVETGATNPTA